MHIKTEFYTVNELSRMILQEVLFSINGELDDGRTCRQFFYGKILDCKPDSVTISYFRTDDDGKLVEVEMKLKSGDYKAYKNFEPWPPEFLLK